MDIFGKALLDFHRGQVSHPIVIRRDDDFTDTHSAALYFEAEPQTHEAEVLAQLKGRVLDVGCGAGRHLLWMQDQGIEAVGIDISPDAVQVCQERGCHRAINCDVMSDELPFQPASFDTATLFGNNIGIGGDLAGTQTLLRNLRRLTADDGRVLVTSIDVAQTTNAAHLEYHRRNREAGLPIGQIRMRFEYRGQTGSWLGWLHPQPEELAELAAASGWKLHHLKTCSNGLYGAVLRAD